jgi:hypothetical protein
MSYTKHILKDERCNYLNFSKQSAYEMLSPCIHESLPESSNSVSSEPIVENRTQFIDTRITPVLKEGFTSDISSSGGVSNRLSKPSYPLHSDNKYHRLFRNSDWNHLEVRGSAPHQKPYKICSGDLVFKGYGAGGDIHCEEPKQNKKNVYRADSTFGNMLSNIF